MGLNTIVLIHNDSLGAIEQDNLFGKNLHEVISSLHHNSRQSDRWVSALGHVNAAEVISTAHADNFQIVACGQNSGKLLGIVGGPFPKDEETSLQLLRNLASSLGYSLRKNNFKAS